MNPKNIRQIYNGCRGVIAIVNNGATAKSTPRIPSTTTTDRSIVIWNVINSHIAAAINNVGNNSSITVTNTITLTLGTRTADHTEDNHSYTARNSNNVHIRWSVRWWLYRPMWVATKYSFCLISSSFFTIIRCYYFAILFSLLLFLNFFCLLVLFNKYLRYEFCGKLLSRAVIVAYCSRINFLDNCLAKNDNSFMHPLYCLTSHGAYFCINLAECLIVCIKITEITTFYRQQL